MGSLKTHWMKYINDVHIVINPTDPLALSKGMKY
jgi:hypothetical protein